MVVSTNIMECLKLLSTSLFIVFIDWMFLKKSSWIKNNLFDKRALIGRSWNISINGFLKK